MLVKENVENISKIVDKLFTFVRMDEDIQKDLITYIESFQEKINSEAQLNAVLIPYTFERTLAESQKTVVELFLEKNSDLNKEEKQLVQGLNNSISSIFEIKKILKNGFELNNLVNEKDYNALTLVKMVNFRGLTQGQYLAGRIFPYAGDHYLIEVNNIIPSTAKEEAYRLAVVKQLENPELLYKDNQEKLEEVQKTVQDVGLKFVDYFKKDEIITTTQYVDELLGGFNDFAETGSQESIININNLIHLPEKFAYFEVKEVTNGVSDIAEAAAKGFSGHEKIYDVGVIYDSSLGLLVLPFYGTFREIFAVEDYKSVEGYKECILNYLNSDKVPHTPIMKAYEANKDNFVKIMKEVLELDNEPDIQELIHQYKSAYLKQHKFSSPTVLYSSKAFNSLMGYAEEKANQEDSIDEKVGRNEPCPCGSGKKYKKCCLK